MKKIKLYKYLLSNPIASQRKMAEDLEISVGTINSLIKKGILEKEIEVNEISYREKEYILTSKAKELYQSFGKVQTAVILAAGEEKEFNFPRSFLMLEKESLLERHIKLLKVNNVKKIVVIVGQEIERYEELKEKYNLIIIKNELYKTTGTLYSLSLIKNYIKEDFILIEGDLIYQEVALKFLLIDTSYNSTIISEISDRSDNVYVNIENTNLTRISKDRYSLGNISGELVGISKISYLFFKDMLKELERNSNPLYFYEYALERVSREKKLKCLLIPSLLWGEIDNKRQYNEAKKLYKKIREREDD
ncbi:MAG: NTP transferase domain-containing protein [Psychrilyobacter sp.]|uniref:phosphocholine cytidylyltransferase family protein n=1 Tax=Psychrilyobacter sp. TaxID=2586924 RepID=UPI003C792AFD